MSTHVGACSFDMLPSTSSLLAARLSWACVPGLSGYDDLAPIYTYIYIYKVTPPPPAPHVYIYIYVMYYTNNNIYVYIHTLCNTVCLHIVLRSMDNSVRIAMVGFTLVVQLTCFQDST